MLFVSARITSQESLNFLKYDIEQFYRDCVTLYKFRLNLAVMTDTLNANIHTLLP